MASVLEVVVAALAVLVAHALPGIYGQVLPYDPACIRPIYTEEVGPLDITTAVPPEGIAVRQQSSACQPQMHKIPLQLDSNIDWMTNNLRVMGVNMTCFRLTVALRESCLEGSGEERVYTQCDVREESLGSDGACTCDLSCACQTTCPEGIVAYSSKGYDPDITVNSIATVSVP